MPKNFTASDVPDQTGRTILVTGANTGIGYEAARILAERGARVLLACRSEEKADAAIAEIARLVPQADLAFVPLDLADLGSIETAAKIVQREPRLDVLYNNAGIMVPPLGRTADGFEQQFGVNHLGTFALTGHLIDKLLATPESRIVVTSSIAHRRGKIFFDDLAADSSYERWPRYAQSKLANLLHITELARRLAARDATTIAVACHPGVAQTELVRYIPAPLKVLSPLTGLLLNTAEQGAWAGLAAATAPDVSNGDYLGPSGLMEVAGKVGAAKAEPHARDYASARRLWEVSEELTGVRYLNDV